MNRRRRLPFLFLCVALGLAEPVGFGQAFVTPMMGGGQVAAEMIHIDLSYDADANQLHAWVDDTAPRPELRPLEPGNAFDPQQPWAALEGKAYNSQYGWNVGGFFLMPPGAAIWVELTDATASLETYSGWGRSGSYVPIFGTAGAPRLWKWSGVMVHNTYAILNPVVDRVFAEYHIYFGDTDTGSRAGFEALGDARIRLEWKTAPAEDPLTFKFGAPGQTNGAPLSFLNAGQFVVEPALVLSFNLTNAGPCALQFEGSLPMAAVAATEANGGPVADHAALGSCIELEMVSLAGPRQAALSFWEAGESQPRWRVLTGEVAGTNRVRISENEGTSGADPFGRSQGRHFAVDQPGLYTLGFRLVDTSTNGPAGGPIHGPSPAYRVYGQAGVTIGSIRRQVPTATVSFGGEVGKSFSLQSTLDLAPSTWQTVAGPLIGTNRLQSFTIPAGPNSHCFYRLLSETTKN